MASAQGPLGVLPGMRWDSSKQKYFPATAAPPRPPSSADIARLRDLIPRGPSSSRSGVSGGRLVGGGPSGAGDLGRNGGQRAMMTSRGMRQIGHVDGSGNRDSRVKRDGLSTATIVGVNEDAPSSGGKRRRILHLPRGRSGLPYMKGNTDTQEGLLRRHYEALDLNTIHHCGCCNDTITSLHPYLNDSYLATTAHGSVISNDGRGDGVVKYDTCSSGVKGLHNDIARMTKVIVSEGPDPHIHLYKRSAENPDALISEADDVPRSKDVYAVSGADGKVSIASTRAIHSMTYDHGIVWSSRKMPSDPLALHQVDANLVFAGLRNGSAHLVDLRTPRGTPGFTVSSLGGKAIVGVKKLHEGTVPWGLAVSAMNHEMLVFDVRFPSTPLHFLENHHNTAYTDLGWAFSSSDRFLFAASSRTNTGSLPNHTINVWNLRTGTRLLPSTSDAKVTRHAGQVSLLDMKFPDRITAIAVREGDRGVDVGSGAGLYRFGPLLEDGMGKGKGQGRGRAAGVLSGGVGMRRVEGQGAEGGLRRSGRWLGLGARRRYVVDSSDEDEEDDRHDHEDDHDEGDNDDDGTGDMLGHF